MSITSQCMECEATSLNGVMKHAKGCSGYVPLPTLGTVGPATKLTFSSQEEADEWYKKLKSGQFNGTYQD